MQLLFPVGNFRFSAEIFPLLINRKAIKNSEFVLRSPRLDFYLHTIDKSGEEQDKKVSRFPLTSQKAQVVRLPLLGLLE
jgi:hypothetical protein